MASRSREDLVRVGKEGFDIIDQLYENKGRKGGASARKPPQALPKVREACLHHQYQPQQSHVYMVNPSEKMKKHEVMHFHDGVKDMDYSKWNSAPKFY